MTESARTRHLIIAGSTKCATTSLHAYLITHPEVCGARMKETRYFLHSEYPIAVRRSYRPGTSYESLFDSAGDRLRLEATPDYLYSEGTAHRMRELPGLKVAFVLRHPIDRLLSWYRYARQTGMLARDVTADDYVCAQLDGQAPREQHYLALEQGLYSRYLAAYFDCLESEQLLLLRYEDVVTQPAAAVERLCRFAGIDASHFRGFDFRVHNRTVDPRFPALVRGYRRVRAWAQACVIGMPRASAALHAMRIRVARLLPSASPSTELAPALAAGVRERLIAYYKGEGQCVARLAAGDGRSWWPDLDPECAVDMRMEAVARRASGRP